MSIIIILVISIATILAVFIFSSEVIWSFFDHSNDTASGQGDLINCDTMCFKCCMVTPDECSGINIKQYIIDSGCNCNC